MAETEASRIRCQGICKSYPGVIANHQISLSIQPGEIHALLGENGAGKSTLMKILYGVTSPDAGQIWWNGDSASITSPAVAKDMGIGMVFQHFALFETLTVAENISLALPVSQSKPYRRFTERIRHISEHYGIPIDPERYVHTLSTGERQRVEIVRCLLQQTSLLILDEPTSVLTPAEVNKLFSTLKQLASEGCSILFVSHKLHEVQNLCDSATILRQGNVAGECPPKTTSIHDMATMMVGTHTELGIPYPKVNGHEPCLAVTDLCVPSEDPFGTDLHAINLTVKSGEILGLAGVAGSGQKELLQLLSGEKLSNKADTITLCNAALGRQPPAYRRQCGLAIVPEERLGRGAVPALSLQDNALLTGFIKHMVHKGFLRTQTITHYAERVIREFGVKTPTSQSAAGSLSGGNLQKFIIGREILQQPKLLVCASPTWGVDVGAANTIHKALIALRDQGAAIMIFSEDLDELFQVSDRIGALCDGHLSPVASTQHTTLEQVGRWMAGAFDRPQEREPQDTQCV